MLGKKIKTFRDYLVKRHMSQAALEFLMTYGWAILIVLASIGLLAYFGVLSPDMFLPNKCILPAGVVCLDYRVEKYRAILVLQNAQGEFITIDKVIISANNQECYSNESINVNNNEKIIITIVQCNNGEEGTKFNAEVNVTYTVEGKLSHSIVGTLKTRIVEGSSISNQGICQNAQNDGLCNGLDLVFGLGYKQACCNEFILCC